MWFNDSSKFIEFCNHHHNPVLEKLYHCRKIAYALSRRFSLPFPALGNHWSAFCLYVFLSRPFIEMESWNRYFSVSDIFHLTWCFWSSFTLKHVSVVCFLLWSSIPLYGYATLKKKYIHLLIDIWIASCLGLLWIMLPWRFMYMCLCGTAQLLRGNVSTSAWKAEAKVCLGNQAK